MFDNKKQTVMKNSISFKLKPIYFVALLTCFGLTSCGSYQYVSSNDGIYDEEPETKVIEIEEVIETGDNSSNYYSNYFRESGTENEVLADENEVFTDVDSYTSSNDEQINNNTGWGENSSNININVYETGWGNNWGWNASPYFRRSVWNHWNWNSPYQNWNFAYNTGWNNWGFNRGFYGGWNSPFFGNGFGYGNNYYNGYNSYYGSNYRNGYRNYAYTNSRRGSNRANYFGRSNTVN